MENGFCSNGGVRPLGAPPGVQSTSCRQRSQSVSTVRGTDACQCWQFAHCAQQILKARKRTTFCTLLAGVAIVPPTPLRSARGHAPHPRRADATAWLEHAVQLDRVLRHLGRRWGPAPVAPQGVELGPQLRGVLPEPLVFLLQLAQAAVQAVLLDQRIRGAPRLAQPPRTRARRVSARRPWAPLSAEKSRLDVACHPST